MVDARVDTNKVNPRADDINGKLIIVIKGFHTQQCATQDNENRMLSFVMYLF